MRLVEAASRQLTRNGAEETQPGGAVKLERQRMGPDAQLLLARESALQFRGSVEWAAALVNMRGAP
jgi:hypothetical protein